jgi:hypothetical protein
VSSYGGVFVVNATLTGGSEGRSGGHMGGGGVPHALWGRNGDPAVDELALSPAQVNEARKKRGGGLTG